MTPAISVNNLAARYGKTSVFSGVSLAIGTGERWALIGQNGCGKSTLLRCLCGLHTPHAGTIEINGSKLSTLPHAERARRIAFVPQASGRTAPPFTVYDFVTMARFPYAGLFSNQSRHDAIRVHEALALTETEHLGNRTMTTLSGGELQRVLLASAAAQDTQILLLDEPDAFLDPLHRAHIRSALKILHAERKCTIITVGHDVNAVLADETHVAVLKSGTLLFEGPTPDIDSFRTLIGITYDIPFETAVNARTGRIILHPEAVV